jgi:2-amino-4-hydroxy-6-hydroxymethyldihydropteridine diphosphokinase
MSLPEIGALETAWTTAFVGLGSNIGDRRRNIERAVALVGDSPAVRWKRLSRLRETEPEGGPEQARYLNAAGEIETTLAATELLDLLLEVEARLGRLRRVRWGPRSIDLDLLTFGGLVVTTPRLTLPHPRLLDRVFVVRPLAEIAPQAVHPLTRRSFACHLRELEVRTRRACACGCRQAMGR